MRNLKRMTMVFCTLFGAVLAIHWLALAEVKKIGAEVKLPEAKVAPRNRIRPVRLCDVGISGRIGKRHAATIPFMLHIHDSYAEYMLDPFRLRDERQELYEAEMKRPAREKKRVPGGWPWEKFMDVWGGEYAGKWLDAAARFSANTGDAGLRRRMEMFFGRVGFFQMEDGYIGCDGPGRRGKGGWDPWNLWYPIAAWVTHYETTGERMSLDSAKLASDWIIRNYGPIEGPKSPFLGTGGWGMAPVPTDQMMRVYAYTADDGTLGFCRNAMKFFPPLAAMREEKKAWVTTADKQRRGHAYVLCAWLNGSVRVTQADDGTDERKFLDTIHGDLCANHLYPTGGLGRGEQIWETAPGGADHHPQETCATVEWLFFNHQMYLMTGDKRYSDTLENIVCNALLAAQSPDGQKYMYYTPLNGNKKWWNSPRPLCCYYSALRGMSLLPQLVYAFDGDALCVNLFEDSRLNFRHKGGGIALEQQTDFPATGAVRIVFNSSSGGALRLKIRVPAGVENVRVLVNGRVDGKALDANGDYVSLERRFNKRDRIDIAFDIKTFFRRLNDGTVTIFRGPEALSANLNDNRELGKRIEQLVAPAGLTVTALELSADGRRRYAAGMLLDEKPVNVVLTPYADSEGEIVTVFKTR